ncbi:unnamed protein product [Clonostachys solani]|uniref:Ubiquitin conjugation factor E4 B n=1 Tax=Clonostachys solani TaxID=160281 RepID=A0A9N9WB02_9HYPO|nr:unnamed protein product [Clonostachys solani]
MDVSDPVTPGRAPSAREPPEPTDGESQPSPRRASRTSESSTEDGYRMSPAAARRFARRNLRRTSPTPDLVTSLVRPPSPEAFYVTDQFRQNNARLDYGASSMARLRPITGGRALAPSPRRRSGPLQSPHPSSLDIPNKYGGNCIFDMYALTYVQEPDPSLLCPICHDPLVDPVTTPCDHTFCYRCLRRSIESSPSGTACPIDREPLVWSDCFSVERLVRTQLNSLLVKCPNRNRGCNKQVRREAVESHARIDCRFKDYPCPDAECDKRVRDKSADDKCLHDESPCKYCHEAVEEADKEWHLVSCPKTKTRCEACWQLVPKASMTEHHELECDGAEVACTYHDLGCPVRMERGHLAEHTFSCAFHPDTASGIIIRSQRELIQTYSNLSTRMQDMQKVQEETAQRLEQLTKAVDKSGPISTSSVSENRTIQDLDAGFEEVHQNLTHLEARQSMWTLNQVMPIREEVAELRNNVNMIRMHLNWLRSREEGRMRAANNMTSADRNPVLAERRRSSSTDMDIPPMDPNENPPSWVGGDGPDKEKMEQIRARRLAKLGSSAPAAPKSDDASSSTGGQPRKPSSPAPSASSSSSAPKPKPAVAGAPSSNPFSRLGTDDGSRKTSDQTSSTGTPRPSRKRPASDNVDVGSPAPPPHRPTPPPAESDEDYANRVLSQIFRITVNPHQMASSGGQRLIFLPGLNEELNESREPLKITTANLDQAVLEAASSLPQDKPLMDFLLPCWKRAVKAASSSRFPTGPKHEAHEESKRLALSHCLFSLTLPDLYGRGPNPNHDSLLPYILRGVLDENGLDLEFYKEAIKRFDDDEAVPSLFTDSMVKISTRLGTMSMEDDYRPYVQALLIYTRFPVLITNLAKHPTFNMAQSAPGIEKHTLLGPFFRLSPLQPEAIRSYFPGARTLDKSRIANAQDSLRMVLRTHQDDLFVIANAFIRAGLETRSRTLDWFAYVMNSNHKRRALQVDPREVASDGFMMNITTILDRFCEPFMDNDFSKIDKIDVRYFKRKPRVDIKDETKINADQAAADEYYSQTEAGESNFISEAFFLTLAAHHYGSEAANSQLKNLDREIKYLEKHIKAMEAERPKVANVPAQLRLFEETLKRRTTVLEKTIALKHAIEGVLLDERMQSTSLRFMRYVAVWLLRLATGSDYKPGQESQQISLPLSAEQHNGAFACLPEYALQNIVDNFKFVFKWLPNILLSAVGEELIALCVTLLRSSEYIKNPYLKSSLVTLLFSGTWPFMHLKKGVLGDQLIGMKFANDYLLHALMKFYIEAESTGVNTQFYDKFNIRYEIFQVIKCVWVNDVYRQQLTRESHVNKQFFVRFVNLLLNDATYVLDEAFTKFPKIRTIERELEDPTLSAEDRQKKEEELQTLGSQAASYMQLANETLEMMKLFTEALGDSFTMPEIVTRLASMLNYNLDTLAGKKAGAELNVSNREKYHFRPIQLISDFVWIYLNLASSKIFIDAVAADGRSYKPEVLDRVSRILQSRNHMDPADIGRWNTLKAKFFESKQVLDQAELDLGDIPAEFEDPIMGDLMTDPVLLPSKHIVDRSTIAQHLLSDPKDPFTRQPMTMDDVIPQDELREKIEKWKEEKVKAAREKFEPTPMDTSE